MSHIFISYRRADTADMSGRIFDRLEAHFGAGTIFKDVDVIPAGVDFRAHIQQALNQCTAALILIGPRWLTEADAHGNRRIDDANDFARIEVETLLQRGIGVLPLLINGATMPPADQLPPSVAALSYINALPVRSDPDFRHDMERLIRALAAYMPATAPAIASAPSAAPVPAVGQSTQAFTISAMYDVPAPWHTLGGKAIKRSAVEDGRFERSHRMTGWLPWPDVLDRMWDRCRTLDPDCQRMRGDLRLKKTLLTGSRLQVLFLSNRFRAAAMVEYSTNGVKKVLLTLEAPDTATLDLLTRTLGPDILSTRLA